MLQTVDMEIFLGVLALVGATVATVLQVLDSKKPGEKIGKVKVGRIALAVILLLVGVLLLLNKETPATPVTVQTTDSVHDTVKVTDTIKVAVKPRERIEVRIIPFSGRINPNIAKTSDSTYSVEVSFNNRGTVTVKDFKVKHLVLVKNDDGSVLIAPEDLTISMNTSDDFPPLGENVYVGTNSIIQGRFRPQAFFYLCAVWCFKDGSGQKYGPYQKFYKIRVINAGRPMASLEATEADSVQNEFVKAHHWPTKFF